MDVCEFSARNPGGLVLRIGFLLSGLLCLTLLYQMPARAEVLMEDGRIELEAPDNLPDPERWRFVPWERMPKGNILGIFGRYRYTWRVLPYNLSATCCLS